MTSRLLQVSDLHVGAHDGRRAEIEEALRALVGELRPELVVASGDLTHRNRRDEHRRAGEILRALAVPLLVVPGNHDLPVFPPARLTRPFAAFLAEWPGAEPVYRSDGLVVVGLNSVRPWKYQRGALSTSQLERAARELASAPPGALRVVVLHHHLTGAPWRTGKRPIPSRTRVLAALAEAGAELVVSGHIHQGVVVERRELLSSPGRSGGLVLAVAPGLGRPRPSRHAEANGVQLYDAEPASLGVRTYVWADGRFEPIAERTFTRG